MENNSALLAGQAQPGIAAQVTAIFGTSMEVMISVCGERLDQASVFHCGDAFATVVLVDAHGLPVDIPFDLEARDAADVQRCAAAQSRREERLAMREALMLTQFARRSLDGRMGS